MKKKTWSIIGWMSFAIPMVIIFYSFLFFTDVPRVAALPETASSTFPFANGYVHALAQGPDGMIYVGGAFTYLGPYTGSGVPMDKSTGTRLSGHSVFTGTSYNVQKVISDGSTGWYVAGDFGLVGGNVRTGIVHILSDGSVDTGFDVNFSYASVQELVLDSAHNRLFLSGSITDANAASRNLVVVNATTGALIDWQAPMEPSWGNIKAMALDGDTLYIGGQFSSIGGVARNNIAAIDVSTIEVDSNATITSWDPSVNYYSPQINDIKVDTTSVFIGGNFDTIGGDTRNHLAEISKTTGSSTAWNPNVTGTGVYDLEIDTDSNSVYVGGAFSLVGVDTRNNAAAVDKTTGAATAWNPNADGIVFSLQINGNNIYLGGGFSTISGESKGGVTLMTKDTAINDVTFSADASGYVYTLRVNGSQIFIGGAFNSIGGKARTRLAAINPSTGSITSWNPSADGTVYSLAADDTNIYVGGAFANIGSTPRSKLAAIKTDGTLQSWDPSLGANSYGVLDIALYGNSVYVGGDITSVGIDSRAYLAEIDKTTGAATAWNPSLSGGSSGVKAVEVTADTVYASGDFSTVGVDSRNKLAAIDRTTGAATAWDPNMSGGFSAVNGLAIGTSTIFVGGDFTNIGGQSRNMVAEIDLSTGNATAWNANATSGMGGITKIAVSTSTVYLAGGFSGIGGQSYAKLAAVDRYSGLAVANWNPYLGIGGLDGANTILSFGSSLIVGGSFSRLGTLPNGKLGLFGPVDVGFMSTSVSGVEAFTPGTLTIGILSGNTSTQDITVDYTVVGGTATGDGTDYTLANGTATLSAGATSTEVSITVVSDETVEANETIIVNLSNPQNTVLSSNAAATYTITNDDIAPPGIAMVQSSSSTAVTEGGAEDTYTIALRSEPTSNVTMVLSEANSQLTFSTSSIVFTPTNWSDAVTVTTTAVNDSIAESTHTTLITHSITSADGNYNAVPIVDVAVTITDDADIAGVTVTQSGGTTTVSESGISDTYTLVLTSQPTSTVSIALAPSSADVVLSTSTIEFTAANWSSAVSVTVSPVDDAEYEGAETVTITHTVTSGNWNYNGISVSSVSVSVTDNDSASTEEPSLGGRNFFIVNPPVLPSIVPLTTPPTETLVPLELNVEQPVHVGIHSHTVQMLSFSSERITFILRSDPVQVTLPQGDSLDIDTNSDGIADVQAKYNGVEDGKPVLKLSSLLDDGELKKSITINKGAYKTISPMVEIFFNVENAQSFALSHTPNFDGVNFIPYVTSTAWRLTSEAGLKAVYVRFKSPQGGTVDAFDTIQFDPTDAYNPVDDEKLKVPTLPMVPYFCPLEEGEAYKVPGTSAVYYIVGKDGEDTLSKEKQICTKRPFKNPATFFSYFTSYQDIQPTTVEILSIIPNDTANFMPLGPLAQVQSGSVVKSITDNKVFLVLGTNLHWIQTEKVFSMVQFAFTMVEDFSSSLLSKLKPASALDENLVLPEGTVFRYQNDTDVYRLDSDVSRTPSRLVKRKFKNIEDVKRLYRADRILVIDGQRFYPDGPPIQ